MATIIRDNRQNKLKEKANNLIKESSTKKHVNKYAEKHAQELAERERLIKKTPGATQELQYVKNHLYTLEEIKNFNIIDAIDESQLATKVGNVKSKLAYKFIMDNRNLSTKYMLPGQICLFSYNDPKTKDELAYWDKTPLVLFFGIFRTNDGNIREIGLNLHYYPPFTRKKILDRVYTMFKGYFEKCFNAPIHKENAFMDYRTLKHILKKDTKIAFGVKEYVPSLRGLTYVLPTKYLPIAFYTEGHFSRATIKQVQMFWRQARFK